MIWRLRRASVSDAPAIATLARSTFFQTFADLLPAGDMAAHCVRNSSVEQFAGWAADPSVGLTVAEGPDRLLGYSLLTVPDLPVSTGAHDRELRRIYTAAATHGTGLGRALMAKAVADAEEGKAARLLLGVHQNNLRARAFYERNGFAIVGKRRFLVGSTWCDDLVYSRAI